MTLKSVTSVRPIIMTSFCNLTAAVLVAASGAFVVTLLLSSPVLLSLMPLSLDNSALKVFAGLMIAVAKLLSPGIFYFWLVTTVSLVYGRERKPLFLIYAFISAIICGSVLFLYHSWSLIGSLFITAIVLVTALCILPLYFHLLKEFIPDLSFAKQEKNAQETEKNIKDEVTNA